MGHAPGTRFGAFEVLALLGAVGMGEVYRARDTRLEREVSLKVLPEVSSSDPDRLARFQTSRAITLVVNWPSLLKK